MNLATFQELKSKAIDVSRLPIARLVKRHQDTKEKQRRRPYTREYATGDPDLINRWSKLYSFNPDDLVGKKGLKIFDTMKQDDQIRAALAVKKFSRLSTPYKWHPASDEKADEDMADFMNQIISDMPISFVEVMMGVLTALDYGYSICEKNYAYIKQGHYLGKVGLANIKSRKPHDFYFHLDDHSNIQNLTQEQSGKYVEMPIDKFIVFSYQSLWGNPYGESDLKAAYEAWWSKDVILKFWNMHLERWASPVLVAFYESGIEQPVLDTLIEILEDIQIGTVAKVPQGIEIRPIEMKGTGGADLYAKAIEKRDRMICRAMLVPDLLGMGDVTKGGSYALGKKQFDLFFTMLTFLGAQIEELFMEQLTKDLIGLNYANVKDFPPFQFESFEEHGAEEQSKMNVQKAQALQILAGAGFIDPLDEEVQKAALEYMNILPGLGGKGSEMASEALDFKEPFRFTNPDGRSVFEITLEDDLARWDLLQDAIEVA